MMTLAESADAPGDVRGACMHRRPGSSQMRLVEMVPSIAPIAIERIGNRDERQQSATMTIA
jgi:hypothetical protein